MQYKGKAITKLFPSGYYEIYSDAEGRFLSFDDLADAKARIDDEGEQDDPDDGPSMIELFESQGE